MNFLYFALQSPNSRLVLASLLRKDSPSRPRGQVGYTHATQIHKHVRPSPGRPSSKSSSSGGLSEQSHVPTFCCVVQQQAEGDASAKPRRLGQPGYPPFKFL